ncbi:MAG: DUF2848 domain-containing protein [Streptosporangiales bacterium]|nr:DUF2848 domain-containing protein [Streptosporangiales bacterium]
MRFTVQSRSGEREVEPDLRYVLLAGYTGRDQEAVRAHIAELADHGVAAPGTVPAVYAVPATRLVPAGHLTVHGERTAGEAEFLILDDHGELLIGLCSDHTDRELEEHSVVKSKQTCDKPACPTLWEFAELEDHWDDLRLRAEVRTGDGWAVYQEGVLGSLLTPERILAVVGDHVGSLKDVAVFSGTLPLVGGEFRYGPGFRATLDDPVLGRQLTCEYTVEELPDIGS